MLSRPSTPTRTSCWWSSSTKARWWAPRSSATYRGCPAAGRCARRSRVDHGCHAGRAGRGALRAQIEGVRVRSDQRGTGLGERMMRWLIDTARERGADVVQLTSDVTREGAHRFYQRLGFQPTHVGFKMAL
ncbi:GNAT family N-acetyltransferase [Thermocrispum agreste]|uniref:GNAT family N-acetyltransferase n=1 Tax=Thermocrispum agreste TaxID=37925 RepID=UPI003CCBC4E9